jgi:hypothetical protein
VTAEASVIFWSNDGKYAGKLYDDDDDDDDDDDSKPIWPNLGCGRPLENCTLCCMLYRLLENSGLSQFMVLYFRLRIAADLGPRLADQTGIISVVVDYN